MFLFPKNRPYRIRGPRILLFNGYRGSSREYSGQGVKLTDAQVKNEWNHTCTSPIHLHDVGRDDFTFV